MHKNCKKAYSLAVFIFLFFIVPNRVLALQKNYPFIHPLPTIKTLYLEEEECSKMTVFAQIWITKKYITNGHYFYILHRKFSHNNFFIHNKIMEKIQLIEHILPEKIY